MESIRYLRALRRRWWVIILAALVGAGTAGIVTAIARPAPAPKPTVSYSATTVLWNPGAPTIGQRAPITSFEALARVVTTPTVATIANQLLPNPGNPLALATQVQSVADTTTGFLYITAREPEPKRAVAVSNAFSHALIKYLERLKIRRIDQQQVLVQQQINDLRSKGIDPTVIATLRSGLAQLALDRTAPISLTAIQPTKAVPVVVEPVQPKGFRAPKSRAVRILLGALIGLLAGVALALVLERFDTRIRTRQEAEEAFGLPVLAEVPVISRKRRKGIVTAEHPISRAADAFRLLSTGIARGATNGDEPPNRNGKFLRPSSPPKIVLVTSPEPRDGKTTVAANLAAAYAEIGHRVLVLSCDLRHPAIHSVFGVSEHPGLSELLRTVKEGSGNGHQRLHLAPYVEISTVSPVAVLASGATSERPAELLGSEQMQRFLEGVKQISDVTILDCAPLIMASDVVPLLPRADAVVVVAHAGTTRKDVAARTSSLLERLGAKVVGVTLNDAKEFSIPLARKRFYRPSRRARKAARAHPTSGPQPLDAGRDMWAGVKQ